MALFIGSSWKYTAPDTITTGRTYRITARVFPCRPGLKLQAVQDDPEVLGDEVTVPLAFTWQNVALDVVAISADPIVLRCDESLMLVDALEFTEAVLPGLEIINFRYLPEAVKESITAADFSTPANVTVDVDGLKVAVVAGASIDLPDRDNHLIMVEFGGLAASDPLAVKFDSVPNNLISIDAAGLLQATIGGGEGELEAMPGPVVIMRYSATALKAQGMDGGAVAGYGAATSSPGRLIDRLHLFSSGAVPASYIKSFCIQSWDDPEA